MRPGPFMVNLSPSRSGLETGFVAIVLDFSETGFISTKNCDVLSYIMHEVTFTARLTFHIFVEMSVCLYVCMYVCLSTARLGILIYDRDQTCSTKFSKVYTGQ